MAYVDVETERANFRVILGSHTRFRKMDPRQLPPRPTALVLETMFPDAESFPIHVEKGSFTPAFSKLIKAGKEMNIPITSADPATNISKAREVLKKNDRRTGEFIGSANPFLGLKFLIATLLIWDFSSTKINEEGLWYHSARDYEALIRASVLPGESFRNMVMAQRAWRVSEHQITQGIESPLVVIACGCMHIGIANELVVDAHSREKQIRSHPEYGQYFKPRDIRRIPYTQYDTSQGSWKRGQISS